MTWRRSALLAWGAVLSSGTARGADVWDRVEHGYADSGGVKIHYAALGKGPLVVMIHGFPDFWYSWRHQMEALAGAFRVVAIDLRGYNQSDKPKGIASYDMSLLVEDVAAVMRHLGETRAAVVGHDWGAAVAWRFAMLHPEMTEKLVILSVPHPAAFWREVSTNPDQQRASSYARVFQEKSPSDPDVFFGRPMTPETLSGWVRDPEARKKYVGAFQRSDLEAMLNYYKQNYPRPGAGAASLPEMPKVKAPVLFFHGLKDQALLAGGLNGTWEYLEKDLTLMTLPEAGHFIQQDAAELVSTTLQWWLARP